MKKFDMKNPEDRAKLLPGYYWAKSSWSDKVSIVSIYVRKGHRIISTGNEYTEDRLQDLVEQAEMYDDYTYLPIFFGPIEPPEEIKV